MDDVVEGKYPIQTPLLNTPAIKLKVCQTLNPASLISDPHISPIDHQCMQVIDEFYFSHPNLPVIPVTDPEKYGTRMPAASGKRREETDIHREPRINRGEWVSCLRHLSPAG